MKIVEHFKEDVRDSFGQEFEELGVVSKVMVIIMTAVLLPVGMIYGHYLNHRNLSKMKRVVNSARDRMDRINISQASRDRIADEFEVQMDKYMQEIKVRHIQDRHLADIEKIVSDIINKEVYM